MSLVSVPIFVYLLGTETFGLVGLIQALQLLLSILDMGLAATANREAAILRRPEDRQQVANVVRTFEWVYWAVAMGVGLVVAAAAGWIANSWVAKQQSLSSSDIQMAIVLGGITLAARWPVALYTGVLRGLERQVLQNSILMAAAAARVVVSMVALLLISRTVYCFLITQAIVNVGEALATGYAARRLADPGHVGRFDVNVVRRVWRFAVSFNLAGTFGMIAAAAPTLLIPKLLPLTAMTYFSVCGTATGSLQVVYLAAAVSLFPRLAYCWHHKDLAQMNRLYLLNLRLTAYMCLGPVMLLCFFPYEILYLWTCSKEVATQASAILPVMAAAIMVNCAYSPAYNVLMATGHTRLPLIVNIVSLPVVWAGCYYGIQAYGLMGAAVCGLAVNVFCFLICGFYCWKEILQVKSFSPAFGFPVGMLLLAGVVGYLSKAALPADSGPMLTIVWLVLAVLLFYAGGMFLMRGEERRMISIHKRFLHKWIA